MDACPGHILKSTKELPLSYLTFYLNYLSLFYFIKGCFLCDVLVYKWFGLKAMSFIDNSHLGSILHFQRLTCVSVYQGVCTNS